MKFSELNKYKTETLVVSPRHEKWMESNSNPVYSTDARIFSAHAMVDMGRPRDRRGTISASSFGSCKRKQQFTFIGLPEIPPSAKLAAIFQNGVFMHVRWQMAGLTAGWLASAEVPVGDNRYELSGTQDGIADDGTVVEFKSINSNGYRSVTSFGAKQMHITQIATYVMATRAERATIIYENKDTQEYTEKVFPREVLPIADMETDVAVMWDHLERKNLFDVLDKCWDKAGYQYLGCPFRANCLKTKSWEEAQELADSSRS